MSKLPQITAVELMKILSRIGFKVIRQEGSHVFLRHGDVRRQLSQIIREED